MYFLHVLHVVLTMSQRSLEASLSTLFTEEESGLGKQSVWPRREGLAQSYRVASQTGQAGSCCSDCRALQEMSSFPWLRGNMPGATLPVRDGLKVETGRGHREGSSGSARVLAVLMNGPELPPYKRVLDSLSGLGLRPQHPAIMQQ